MQVFMPQSVNPLLLPRPFPSHCPSIPLTRPHRQHFQKLRKEARPGDGDDGGNSPIKSNSAKSTPRKRSKTQSASFSSTSFQNEDDDEEFMTPIKRKKTEVKPEQENCGFPGQTAPLFKIEALDGNDPVLLDDDE
jgi:hypothetical protein